MKAQLTELPTSGLSCYSWCEVGKIYDVVEDDHGCYRVLNIPPDLDPYILKRRFKLLEEVTDGWDSI